VPIADGIAQRENILALRGCRAVDAASFKINANPPGAPAAGIRHRGIEMDRFRRFSAYVRCVGPGARNGGAIFTFALERSADHAPAFRAEHTATAGPTSPWQCELPQLKGPHDAILSVRPASPENGALVSSLWTDAQLS